MAKDCLLILDKMLKALGNPFLLLVRLVLGFIFVQSGWGKCTALTM